MKDSSPSSTPLVFEGVTSTSSIITLKHFRWTREDADIESLGHSYCFIACPRSSRQECKRSCHSRFIHSLITPEMTCPAGAHPLARVQIGLMPLLGAWWGKHVWDSVGVGRRKGGRGKEKGYLFDPSRQYFSSMAVNTSREF